MMIICVLAAHPVDVDGKVLTMSSAGMILQHPLQCTGNSIEKQERRHVMPGAGEKW